MKSKPISAKIQALMNKLEALAERGIDGEKIVAQRKLARLKARYGSNAPIAADASDLFFGKFTRSSKGRWIYTFNPNELDIASSVKWAIESATGLHCIHSGGDLLAEATPAACRRLTEISDHIAQNFRVLLGRFGGLKGVTAGDRSAFLMGLYDGMMNEARAAGQRLPGQAQGSKKRKSRKPSNDASGVNVHPYSIAVGLGRQIRFSAAAEQIRAELEAVVPKFLAQREA